MNDKKKSVSHNKEINDIIYSLKSFRINKFHIIEPLSDITENFDHEKLNVNLKLNFTHDIEKKIINVIISIDYNYLREDGKIKLLDFLLVTIFEINDFKPFIKKDDNIAIPDEMLKTFFSISYSSARGILFEKTQGSYLNQFLLPLVNPNETLKKLLQNKDDDLMKDSTN